MRSGCLFLFLTIFLFCATAVFAQRFNEPLTSVKTNVLAMSAGSLNAALELALRRQIAWDDYMTTISIPVSYNPFTLNKNRKIKHFAFQPEFRIKKPVSLGTAFVGVNLLYAYYNVGGIGLPFRIAQGLREHRYQGQLFGGGVSAGYYFRLGYSLGLETALGAGYAYMDYDVYRCETCGTKTGEGTKNYVGPMKAAVSLVYTIR
jgi:hypothetical protein